MGVSRMTGTPWHLERVTRGEGDDRRHRSRCIYFRKPDAYCERYNGKCHGSTHCRHYNEYQPFHEEEGAPEQNKKTETLDRKVKRLFQVGYKVRHKSFGEGIVKAIKDGRITVEFDGLGEKLLGLDFCVKKGLLSRADD